MPPRFWKGFLRLSLVTCPVALQPATTESEKVRFHTLNRDTGERVVSRYVDSLTGKPVREDDQAKGFQTDPDHYLIMDDAELEAVGLESARTIDIDVFVPRESIPWIYLDSPYFLIPDGAVGEEAFAVIREAMAATDMVGISRLVLGQRERAVMLQPRDKGIIAWTLRYGDEVRKPEAYFNEIPDIKSDPAVMKLAGQLMAQKTRKWSPDMVKDPVQEHLLKLIETKKSRVVRRASTGKPAGPAKNNVVNIFDALRQSIEETLKEDAKPRKRS
jgi:DNA end-binding protein Ku